MTPEEEGTPDLSRRIGAAVLKSAEHRLHLFGLELQEEKIRFLQLLVLAVAGCVAALLGVLAILGLIFWLLPPDGRTAFLLVVIVAAGLAAFLAFRAVNQRLQQAQFFAATRTELEKDRKCLETRS